MIQLLKNFIQSRLMVYSPAVKTTYTVVPATPEYRFILSTKIKPGMITFQTRKNKYNQYISETVVVTDVLVHNKKTKSKNIRDKGVDIRMQFSDGSFRTNNYGSNQVVKIEVKQS